MPTNAKGRLRYPDFLSRFGSEKVATPPATGDSAKAHRGSSVPEVSDGNRSAMSSPTRDLRVGTKQRSHPCVSPPPLSVARCPVPGPQVPLGAGPSRSHGLWVTEQVAQHEPGAGVPGEEAPGGPLAFACLESARWGGGAWRVEGEKRWRRLADLCACRAGDCHRQESQRASGRCHYAQSSPPRATGESRHLHSTGEGARALRGVLTCSGARFERPSFEPRPALVQGQAAGLGLGAGPPRGALASSARPACLGEVLRGSRPRTHLLPTWGALGDGG